MFIGLRRPWWQVYIISPPRQRARASGHGGARRERERDTHTHTHTPPPPEFRPRFIIQRSANGLYLVFMKSSVGRQNETLLLDLSNQMSAAKSEPTLARFSSYSRRWGSAAFVGELMNYSCPARFVYNYVSWLFICCCAGIFYSGHKEGP